MQKKIDLSVSDAHQFALYSDSSVVFGQKSDVVVVIQDESIVHRVVRVLKLRKGESFVIFNREQHVVVKILECTREKIDVLVITNNQNIQLRPRITFLLPLLKKEALEEAIYSLAELGINDVQLVVTEKSRISLSKNDMQRLHKIVIVAAEQAKQYHFPEIYEIKSLQETINDLSLNSDKIVFDMLGENFFELHNKIVAKHIYLLIGPEGGLTKKELLIIKERGFKGCLLTPTVLRALQAVAIGSALFRIRT